MRRVASLFVLLCLLPPVLMAAGTSKKAAPRKTQSTNRSTRTTSKSRAPANKVSSQKKGATASKRSSAAKKTSAATSRKSSPSKKTATTAPKKTTGTKKSAQRSRSSRSRRRSRPAGQQAPTPQRYAEIQQALIARGYLAPPASGVWGPESVDALKRFQRDQNLQPDGKLDSLSLIALGLGPNRETNPPSATGGSGPNDEPRQPQ